MTTVYNIYHGNAPSTAVNIMRPSILGNPFTNTSLHRGSTLIKVDTREEAVEQYRIHFRRKMLLDAEFAATVNQIVLADLDVVCCCAPRACHGDVIKEYADSYIKRRRE